MIKRLPRKNFERIIRERLGPLLWPYGFVEVGPGAYSQDAGEITRGFGITPAKVWDSFFVGVGLSVASLRQKYDFVDGERCFSFEVSHRIGDFLNNMHGGNTCYPAETEHALIESLNRAVKDFEEQAIPWLENFTTVADVAAVFYRRRIAVPKGMSRRPPDPFAWAMYGWMLEECARHDEAKAWIERAIKYLEDKEIVSAGPGFVMLAGPASAPRDEFEDRLLALLKNPGLAEGGHG